MKGNQVCRLAIVAMLVPSSAWAQTATTGTPASTVNAANGSAASQRADGAVEQEDIVVTGFRASLDKAVSIKRSADIVADVIAAEDIGKYPDANIAESLQRVTGVQINRSQGQGSTINIRGLGSNFAITELNGHEIVSGAGRTFDFLSLSPDFVSAVVVEKSQTASQVEGALTGVVDIRTPRPIDIGKSTVAMRLDGTYNTLSKDVSPRASLVANWVNADRTLGMTVGLGYDQRKFITVGRGSYGVERVVESAKNPAIDYNVDGDFNDVYAISHAQQYLVNRLDRKRYNGLFSLQYKPEAGREFYLDTLYSRFDDNRDSKQFSVRGTNIAPATTGQPFGIRSSTISTQYNGQLLPAANGVQPQGFLTAMDADGVDIRGQNSFGDSKTRLFSLSAGTKLDFGRLHVHAEGSYSQGKSFSPYYEYSPSSRGSVALTYPDGIRGEPRNTFVRGYDPLNVATYNLPAPYLIQNDQKDRMYEGQLDLSYEVGGFLQSLKVGADYKNRRLIYTFAQASPSARQLAQFSSGKLVYNAAVEPGYGGSVNVGPYMTTTCFRNSGIPNFLGCFPTLDPAKLFNVVDRGALFAAAPFTIQQANGNRVTEKTIAGYVQADFAGADDRLTGNAGVRVFRTTQTSAGFGTDLNNLTSSGQSNIILPPSGPVSVTNAYTYALPSLNARFAVSDVFAIRFAAGRAIARPDFSQLSTALSVNDIVRTINGGNPNLKPYLSNQADLSLEYYLPKSGLISIATYYKSIDNYIITGQTFPTLTLRNAAGGGTTSVQFTRNAPLNLANAKFKGVELGIQLPLYFLPPSLDGLGVFFNGSYIDAPKVPVSQGGAPQRLAGVSKFSYNIGGYFERSGFGTHVFYNWRSSSFNGGGTFGEGDFSLAYGQLDGSLSYDVNPGITLALDFENLTNAGVRNENNFGLSNGLTYTGRRFTAGVRAKF